MLLVCISGNESVTSDFTSFSVGSLPESNLDHTKSPECEDNIALLNAESKIVQTLFMYDYEG